MITLFAIPKAFEGEFDAIQEKSIRNWRALHDDIQILLFGDGHRLKTLADQVRAEVISSELRYNSFGTPLVSSAFHEAQARARFSTLLYVNSDILFIEGVLETIERIRFPSYLAVGKRTDTLKHRGVPDSLDAIDYFIFTRGLYTNIPDFAIGRCFWDHWLVYAARRDGIPVLDASQTITALHQTHSYAHAKGGKLGVWTGDERDANLRLAGGGSHLFTLRDVTHTITQSSIVPVKESFFSFFKENPLFEFIYDRYFGLKVGAGKWVARIRHSEISLERQ